MLKKIREPLIYIITIIINIVLGNLLTKPLFGNEKYFVMFTIALILLSTLIIFIISNKFGFKLDLFAYNIDSLKFLILNSIYIGNVLSIPVTMFVSILM